VFFCSFVFQAEDGIRDRNVTGVQTCALPIYVAKYIAHASVFVLPSYREGMPRSTQEAMAIGRPVITTDVPGCNETVVDGVTGFLIPKWDIAALVEKMIYFIEHPEQVNKMGYQGFLYAKKNFNADLINYRLSKMLGIDKS